MASNLDAITNAFNNGDYSSVQFYLIELQQSEPNNPWLPYYLVLLEEVTGDVDTAYQKYQALLKEIVHPKILSKIRQKILALETAKKQRRQTALNQARNNNKEAAILVLESINPQNRLQSAQHFAEIMQTDIHSARLQIPLRGWRLYRVGYLGELEFYTKALSQAEIPAFCVGIKALDQLQVYYVQYIQTEKAHSTIQYLTDQDKSATFSFPWNEVTQISQGMVPFFSAMAEVKWQILQAKIEKKSRTTDYIKICDLHLKKQNLILRFTENNYQFAKSILNQEKLHPTVRENWQELMKFFEQKCPNIPRYRDFNIFAETALDFKLVLKNIKPPKIFTGSQQTPYSSAFHLYSSLAFFKEH